MLKNINHIVKKFPDCFHRNSFQMRKASHLLCVFLCIVVLPTVLFAQSTKSHISSDKIFIVTYPSDWKENKTETAAAEFCINAPGAGLLSPCMLKIQINRIAEGYEGADIRGIAEVEHKMWKAQPGQNMNMEVLSSVFQTINDHEWWIVKGKHKQGAKAYFSDTYKTVHNKKVYIFLYFSNEKNYEKNKSAAEKIVRSVEFLTKNNDGPATAESNTPKPTPKPVQAQPAEKVKEVTNTSGYIKKASPIAFSTDPVFTGNIATRWRVACRLNGRLEFNSISDTAKEFEFFTDGRVYAYEKGDMVWTGKYEMAPDKKSFVIATGQEQFPVKIYRHTNDELIIYIDYRIAERMYLLHPARSIKAKNAQQPAKKTSGENKNSTSYEDNSDSGDNGSANKLAASLSKDNLLSCGGKKTSEGKSHEAENIRSCGKGKVLRKSKTQLVFTLTNGKTITLKDDVSDGEESVSYLFEGFSEIFNSYVVSWQGWESSGRSLVNRITGEETEFSGLFVFSPAKQYVAVYDNHIADDIETSAGISLYEVSATGNLNQVYFADTQVDPQKPWGPASVKWLNETSFEVERVIDSGERDPNTGENITKPYGKTIVALKNGKWDGAGGAANVLEERQAYMSNNKTNEANQKTVSSVLTESFAMQYAAPDAKKLSNGWFWLNNEKQAKPLKQYPYTVKNKQYALVLIEVVGISSDGTINESHAAGAEGILVLFEKTSIGWKFVRKANAGHVGTWGRINTRPASLLFTQTATGGKLTMKFEDMHFGKVEKFLRVYDAFTLKTLQKVNPY